MRIKINSATTFHVNADYNTDNQKNIHFYIILCYASELLPMQYAMVRNHPSDLVTL